MGLSVPDSSGIAKKAGCGGCLIPVGMALLALGIGVTLYYLTDVRGTQMLNAGDESKFDPIAAFPYAKELAGHNLQFLDMTARYVRPDGTLDLTAEYGPEVVYEWMGPAVQNDRPMGAGGETGSVTIVSVRATNFGFEETGTAPNGGHYADLNMGLRRRQRVVGMSDSYVPTKPPTCKLSSLWTAAVKAGAPKDAVAVITYDHEGYEFRIDGTGLNLKFGADCAPRK